MPNLYELTAKQSGFYVVYKDGVVVSQHTSERKAIESAEGQKMDFPESLITYKHEYEVDVSLTTAGWTVAGTSAGGQVDLPPVIVGTPSPSFTQGTADTYDMTPFFTDDGLSTVTSQLINTLPNGLNYNGNTHILTYDGVGPQSVSSHGLQVTDAVGSVTSSPFDINITNVSAPRQVDWSANFEDGQLNPRGSGNLDASVTVTRTTRVGAPTFNIVSITKGNPAILSYSGGAPTELLPNSGVNSNGAGYQITGLTGGMSDLNGQLVRLKNVGGGTAELWADNWPEYVAMPASQALGTFTVNTNPGNYSNDSTGGTLQGFNVGNDAGGGYGPNTAYENKVVESGNNQVSADSNVLARNGNYCFHSKIEYHVANFSNNKNKPRMTLRPANDAQMDHDTPFYLGFSIYCPTDLCDDNNNQENMIMNMSANSASQDFFHLLKRGGSGGIPHWYLEWGKNTQSSNQSIDEVLDLGQMDLGVWTDWVFYMDVNPNTGSLRVWKNIQGENPVELTNGQLPIIGTGYGNVKSGTNLNQWTIRQYAFTWHHQASSCTADTQEFLFDEIYIGTVANGTDFSDVHAARASQP